MYPRAISRLTFRARLFVGVLVLFVGLVAARIHGSSVALSAANWAPAQAMEHFVASPLLARMSPTQVATWGPWMKATPRWIRADEWAHETPWALAQFNHQPRFPVVNTHIGEGQNMLVVPWVPVWHLSALGRPLTWGYFFLGPERGLAWSWWFELFSGFVSLYLLFELVVPHRPRLALLGAGWFCGSAYVACWSVWPAHVTALGAFAVVAAYHVLRGRRRAVVLLSGAGLGLTLAGFLMQLYPPWQVPLVVVFTAIFIGLVVRDRAAIFPLSERRTRALALVLGVAAFALVFGSFMVSAADALSAFVNSDYPGRRRLVGGDFPVWKLFAPLYNYLTIEQPPAGSNSSEAAGFFMLFPAAIVGLAASRRLRRRFGAVGWCALAATLFLVAFGDLGFPAWLANATLMSRSQGFRAQLATGLASIVISVQLLAAARHQSLRSRSTIITAAAVFIACLALFLYLGGRFQQMAGYFTTAPPLPAFPSLPPAVIKVSLAAAAMCALLALGRAWLFGPVLAVALVVTSGAFNPLMVGIPSPAASELGQAVTRVLGAERASGARPGLWLTYGGPDYPSPGILLQVMGARAFAGVYEYPQLPLWRTLDPTGQERPKYNRYALVKLLPAPVGTREIVFEQPHYLLLNIHASPDHPAFRALGARYVLTFGDGVMSEPAFKLLYRATDGRFAIWQLPEPAASRGG